MSFKTFKAILITSLVSTLVLMVYAATMEPIRSSLDSDVEDYWGRKICSHNFMYFQYRQSGIAPIFDKETGLPKKCFKLKKGG